MRVVVVQAVAHFSYDGRAVHAGELVTMAPLDAVVAHRHGLVSLTRPRVLPPIPLVPAIELVDVDEVPAPKRRYRRRDLEPEA